MVLELSDNHAPVKTRRFTQQPESWMTDAIRELMSERDSAYRSYRHQKNDGNWKLYKTLRNLTTETIRNAK